MVFALQCGTLAHGCKGGQGQDGDPDLAVPEEWIGPSVHVFSHNQDSQLACQ